MQTEKQPLIDFILGIFPMPAASVLEIVALFHEKNYSKNDYLLREGKVCNEYHFLESGFVRAYAIDLEGNDISTAFYSPNEVVCELYSFFKRIPSGENLQALEDCKTWFISFEQLQQVFHSMPQFREFGRTILVNFYAQLKQRTLSMLQHTAEERYAELLRNSPDIFQHAPLKNIATYLGITDTSLSRIRREYSRR